MKIIHNALYQLDIAGKHAKDISSILTSSDFSNYLKDLIENFKDDTKRKFQFRSDTTEVNILMNCILKEDDVKLRFEKIAERLLDREIKAQAKIEHLEAEIQRGVLIQALLSNNNTKTFIICKADHFEFLDETSFKKTRGLPLKRKIFKAFIVEVNQDHSVSSIHVYDTNSTMAKYWWEDFLELARIHTDAHNTLTALDAMDIKVFNPIKKKHPADHTYLRNSMIRFFRSKEEFKMDEFIDDLFNNYTPEDPGLDVKKLIKVTRELPDKSDFESRFSIEKSEIKKRQKTTFKLNEYIDLVVKQDTEIGTSITAEIGKDGEKYVKIRSELGYERFKRTQVSEN